MKSRKTITDTINELYMIAERVGMVKFEKEEFEQTYREYISLKKQYYKAFDKSKTRTYIIDSREERKEKRQQRKEGREELKSVMNKIKEMEKVLAPMMLQFDLRGIGGVNGAKMMLVDAALYERDIEESNKRQAVRKAISPEANVRVPSLDGASKNSPQKVVKKEEK